MEDDKVLTEPTGCHTRGVWSNDVKWGWLNNSNATLWQTYKKLWKIPIFNGKIHYKWSFSIAMLNYQRVHVVRMNIHLPAICCSPGVQAFDS